MLNISRITYVLVIMAACFQTLSASALAKTTIRGELFRLSVDGSYPNDFDLSPDESTVAAVFQGTIYVWDLAIRGAPTRHPVNNEDFIYQAYFVSQDMLLVKGRNSIYGYNLQTSSVVWTLSYSSFRADPMVGFSREYGLFVTMTSDRLSNGIAKIYRAADGVLLHTLTSRELYYSGSIRFISPTEILSWCNDRQVRRWNIVTGDVTHSSDTSPYKAASRAVIDTNLGLAVTVSSTSDYPKWVVLWDFATLTPRMVKTAATEPGRISAVYSVALSKDGKYLLAGSDEGKVRVWDVATGNDVAQFFDAEFPNWNVSDVQILSDNKRVLSVTGDDLVMWELP